MPHSAQTEEPFYVDSTICRDVEAALKRATTDFGFCRVTRDAFLANTREGDLPGMAGRLGIALRQLRQDRADARQRLAAASASIALAIDNTTPESA